MEVNGEERKNRTRIIGLRLSITEYAALEKSWKKSTCRKLSDYVRYVLFERKITMMVRDQSQDDLMQELILLRKELNAIGNNFNQSVKRLHTLERLAEFRSWMTAYEIQKSTLSNKMEEINLSIKKLAERWLR